MATDQAVSDEMKSVILQLMQADCLRDFNLGGGTNLAIRHNHRVSTDIDLFSQDVVGVERLREISSYFRSNFKDGLLGLMEENFGDNQMAFLRVNVQRNRVPIKIDIIQNIPLLHPIEIFDNIRLIHELDIGALKLVSAADRGTQKDFGDLLLLCGLYSLEKLHFELMKRENTFIGKEFGTIFNVEGLPSGLASDLSALGNFNRATDRKRESNRLILTENSMIPGSWPELGQRWTGVVETYARSKGLRFSPPSRKRKWKNKGIGL
jgi:hypothetical protein